MNSYQRVMGTLLGQPVDRLPVFAVLGAYGAKLTGVDLRTLYSDAAAYVAGQQAVYAQFGFDLVMTPFVYTALSEAFGGETAWSEHQPPNMKRPGMLSVAGAIKAPLPDPQTTGSLATVLDATHRLADIFKERVPIIGVLPGPGIMPSLVVGMERWMETLLFEPDLARQLTDHLTPFFVAWANALLDAGADCLVITEGMASAEIAPRDLFQARVLPLLSTTFPQVRGPKVLHHTGGRINHVLDLVTGLPGLVGVAIGSKDSLAQARALVGPNLNLIGNLDNLAFPSVPDEQIYQSSRSCIREAGAAGHYILSNSGADIPLATPPENLRAMHRAIADVGSRSGAWS
ncbi:uroporphyrinogen decarboxylase family protein [Geomesophilobacter sediminis]|uniref:Uroporphyrinogen decarboxylase family protein n=1 Tax=Geomesophilobacter sediminis TaxID=2798584 RepID=A0A8J7IQU9_9BACT|nr:uroporphyrinogen decarboxylase family protein [Geomesophilobacter sediminis]MBJ6726348.1 uroporphyrinogen decarboxylase family protein [Geomesophilobacter sediminis]